MRVKPESQRSRAWRMGGFDLDGTLINGSTVLLHVGGHLGKLSDAKQLVAGYERYELSNEEVAIEAAKMFVGLTRHDLMQLMDDVPRLSDIKDAVALLKAKSIWAVVATVSFKFAAEWFVAKYGFDNCYGITLDFDERGKATGEILTRVTEETKADFIASESERRGFALEDVFYVGDSRSDVPTFRIVGCAVAINASPEAKRSAHASIHTKELREALSLVPNLA